MAWKILTLGLLVMLLSEARTQVPAAGTAATSMPGTGAAAGAAGAAAGTAGAAGTARAAGTAGVGLGRANTLTTSPKHVFCTRPPMAQSPKMPIFHMNVNTGFFNGYRSNQSVVVEITAKYPEVWRINQVFIRVPDNDPLVYRTRPVGYRAPKVVGRWAWNLMLPQEAGGLEEGVKKSSCRKLDWLRESKGYVFAVGGPGAGVKGLREDPTKDPEVGGTQPVDCGGISSYGPFGMLTSMGAHAAKEIPGLINDPTNPHKGYSKIVAKWVPPTNWENIIYRKMITVEAYVTFEKTPPGAGRSHYHSPYNYNNHYQSHHHYGPKPARWVRKQASLLNLDYVDIHNYLMRFRPYMNMMRKFMVAIKKK